MARIRTIKPEFWGSRDVKPLSRDARLLFIGLISMADDDGRFLASPTAVNGFVFPNDDLPTARVRKWMCELAAQGVIVLYQVDDVEYGWVPEFRKHQVINKPMKSKLPAPPTRTELVRETSHTTTGKLPEGYGSTTGGLPEDYGQEVEVEVEVEEPPLASLGDPHDTTTDDPPPKPKRGTRLPADFIPDEAARKWLMAKHPEIGRDFILDQTDRFRNHFGAQSGQRGVKLNWNLAWRNWMAEAVDRTRVNGGRRTRQQETEDLFARAAVRLGATDPLAIEGANA